MLLKQECNNMNEVCNVTCIFLYKYILSNTHKIKYKLLIHRTHVIIPFSISFLLVKEGHLHPIERLCLARTHLLSNTSTFVGCFFYMAFNNYNNTWFPFSWLTQTHKWAEK